MKPRVNRQTSRYSRASIRNAKQLLRRWSRAGGAVRLVWEPGDKDISPDERPGERVLLWPPPFSDAAIFVSVRTIAILLGAHTRFERGVACRV